VNGYAVRHQKPPRHSLLPVVAPIARRDAAADIAVPYAFVGCAAFELTTDRRFARAPGRAAPLLQGPVLDVTGANALLM